MKYTDEVLDANRRVWIDLLNSGEYEQGNGKLQSGTSFCCLGVACLAAENEGIELDRSEEESEIIGGSLANQPPVMDWIGLKNDFGLAVDNSGALACLNDELDDFSHIYTHNDIADILLKDLTKDIDKRVYFASASENNERIDLLKEENE